MQKKRQIELFRVSWENFVPDMRRGRVCGESYVPGMRRGRVCRESFVPEVGPCGSCWASFVPDMRRGRVSRESFVPKGPGVVVVGRIMSCSGVVLVPVGGRSALAPLMGSAAESSVSWRSPRRRWGFCTTRSPLTACRRRVEPSCSAIPPIGGAAVQKQRTYSNAPPEAGRGATATINQAFCSAPCMANIRITMIELLSAWNSHE